MSFFDTPPPAPPPIPPQPPRQEWMGPPEGWLGGFVPTRVVLTKQPELAITLGPMEAYPTGVLVELRITTRKPTSGPGPMLGTGGGGMRLGVAYADGGKWQGRSGLPHHDLSEPPAAPNIWFHGGGGGSNHFAHRLWLWPLPPPGPVTFGLEWEEEGVPETTVDIDGTVFQRAAEEPEPLWTPLTPEEHHVLMQEHLRTRGHRPPPGTGFTTGTLGIPR